MKIVQLCPYAMERPGGVQRHVRDLSAWLETRGHQVRVIAPPTAGRAPRRDGLLTEIGRSRAFGAHGTAFELSGGAPWRLRAATQELRDWGAELVHMHTPWTPMLVWQMWRALRLPTVTTIHATLPELQGKGLVDRYIRYAARHFLRHSRAVVVPSEAPLPMLHGLAPGLAAHVLPPAIDLTSWRDTQRSEHKGLSLVFLGRLEARKGVDVLLKAWAHCAPALPDATLTIAGGGEMQRQVMAASLPRLLYLSRPDDTEARALLAGADIFVAPASYGESYGLVLAEAMAAGAVPIAAANDGYRSVLGADGADMLVPPGDAQALSAKITEFTGDAARLNIMREWARNRSLETDVSRAGPAYEALYRSVLNGA